MVSQWLLKPKSTNKHTALILKSSAFAATEKQWQNKAIRPVSEALVLQCLTAPGTTAIGTLQAFAMGIICAEFFNRQTAYFPHF
jgi:hypothetical protein